MCAWADRVVVLQFYLKYNFFYRWRPIVAIVTRAALPLYFARSRSHLRSRTLDREGLRAMLSNQEKIEKTKPEKGHFATTISTTREIRAMKNRTCRNIHSFVGEPARGVISTKWQRNGIALKLRVHGSVLIPSTWNFLNIKNRDIYIYTIYISLKTTPRTLT